MHRGRRMQYDVHGGGVPHRPTPVYPNGTLPRRFQPLSHDSLLYHNVYRQTPDWRPYNTIRHPPMNRAPSERAYMDHHGNPHYSSESVFYLHDLWKPPNGPGAQFKPYHSEGRLHRRPSEPIVDFPDSGMDPPGEHHDSIGQEVARGREIFYDDDDLETASTPTRDSNQSEAELNSEYVPLETIRRVKEQAREQAMRMKKSQNGGVVRTPADTGGRRGRGNFTPHYDHPRSQRSTIPDGIVAGMESDVSGRRLVSIPDPTHYATISDASELETERSGAARAPEPPQRPASFNADGLRYDRPARRSKRNSSADPIIEPIKHHQELARFKRVMCVFLLFVAVLLLVVYGGFLLMFLLSDPAVLKGCRDDVACSNTVLIIAGAALAGCIMLCLCTSCCCWCCFVCYTHSVNRRRAYPIHANHHRPHRHQNEV